MTADQLERLSSGSFVVRFEDDAEVKQRYYVRVVARNSLEEVIYLCLSHSTDAECESVIVPRAALLRPWWQEYLPEPIPALTEVEL